MVKNPHTTGSHTATYVRPGRVGFTHKFLSPIRKRPHEAPQLTKGLPRFPRQLKFNPWPQTQAQSSSVLRALQGASHDHKQSILGRKKQYHQATLLSGPNFQCRPRHLPANCPVAGREQGRSMSALRGKQKNPGPGRAALSLPKNAEAGGGS